MKFLQKKSPHFLCGDNRKVAKRYFYALVLGAIVSTRLLKSGNEFGVADELSKSRELIASFINMLDSHPNLPAFLKIFKAPGCTKHTVFRFLEHLFLHKKTAEKELLFSVSIPFFFVCEGIRLFFFHGSPFFFLIFALNFCDSIHPFLSGPIIHFFLLLFCLAVPRCLRLVMTSKKTIFLARLVFVRPATNLAPRSVFS